MANASLANSQPESRMREIRKSGSEGERDKPMSHSYLYQESLRLARGLLWDSRFTHFAAYHFPPKIPFPPFLFEHFSDTRI